MKSSTTTNALILAGSSLASYGFGLLRDRLLARQFGAGEQLDIFNASFIVPDAIMVIFAGALTVAFIPVFSSIQQQNGTSAAWSLVNTVMNTVVTLLLIAAGLAWISMPWLVELIAPGFSVDQLAQLVSTTRIMLLSPIALGISTVAGAALQGRKRFIGYALSPVMYNGGIVIGLLVLAPQSSWFGGITGAVIGVVLGASMHMLTRISELLLIGWRRQWLPRTLQLAPLAVWKNPQITQMAKLMGPRIVGLAAWQGNLWLFTSLASFLAAGSISVFSFARNFQSLPVSLFGIALATALFPVLAEHYSKLNTTALANSLSTAIRQVLFVTLPATVGMIIVAEPLVTTLLGGGKFDDTAIQLTAGVLMIFAISIPFESVQHLLARTFYAQHNTTTPVLVTLCASGINVIVCSATVLWLGLPGLVLGFVSYMVTQVVLLLWQLRLSGVALHWQTIYPTITRTVFASLVMGVIAKAVQLGLVATINNSLLTLAVTAATGALVYTVMALLLRMSEAMAILTVIKNRLRK